VAAGCGGGDALGPVGTSLPRGGDRPDQERDAGESQASPVQSDFRAHMVRVSNPFLSHGHGERYDAILWADPPNADAGADGAAGIGAAAAAGLHADSDTLVEDLTVRDSRGDRWAGLLVMRRQGAWWRFAAVGPDGQLAASDRTKACDTCHRDAPHGVFPWP
jgi:hypothetical protein